MHPQVFLILSFCAIFSQVSSEYCYYYEATNKTKENYLSCRFQGNNKDLEGISLIHVGHDTTIPVLKKSLFAPYENLKTLYITAANVESIEPGAFDHFNLVMMDLYNNKLTNIKNGTFNLLHTLKFLDISHNKIESLEAYTFTGLTSLEWLSLNSNRLKTISKGTFKHTKNLVALYLNFNDISRLGVETFQNLIYLELLDLSFNSLTTVQYGLFANQQTMETLLLNHNELDDLPDRLFDNATSLAVLDVSENYIKELQENLFRRTKRLKILKFASNKISELNSTFLLSHAPYLTEVHLFLNEWKCDNLKQVLGDFEKNHVLIATATPVLTSNYNGIGCLNN